MSDDISTNVACTLIPVQGFNLLIPNQCIAEILVRPEITPSQTTLDGCIGEVDWLNKKLPVIYFEKLNTSEKSPPSLNKKNIIVAIQFPLNNTEVIHFGILSNQTPQVIPANNQTMDREISPKKTHQYAMSYIQISNKSALIPDLQRIAHSLNKNSNKST